VIINRHIIDLLCILDVQTETGRDAGWGAGPSSSSNILVNRVFAREDGSTPKQFLVACRGSKYGSQNLVRCQETYNETMIASLVDALYMVIPCYIRPGQEPHRIQFSEHTQTQILGYGTLDPFQVLSPLCTCD
jgi:hypothetical protein